MWGNIHAVLFWIKLLFKEGPKHGYFPLPDKSYLVVAPTFMEQAKQLFSPYGINIVEGQRVLGGFIGSIIIIKRDNLGQTQKSIRGINL